MAASNGSSHSVADVTSPTDLGMYMLEPVQLDSIDIMLLMKAAALDSRGISAPVVVREVLADRAQLWRINAKRGRGLVVTQIQERIEERFTPKD